MRTYAGHSTAAASNALYRNNLAKGQTGLSVAFDLPTQTGYDPDSPLARGEVGKVGVPIPHLGEMRRLFDGIPLTEMNTSMTINATAMWLLALYQVVAEEQNGVATGSEAERLEVAHRLAGTTQNDIIKEYLSRGTYVFPPEHSLRLIGDVIAYTVHEIPKWNPINICSYHLQEAGATPTQELAYALCTAIAVLDTVRELRAGLRGGLREGRRPDLVLRQRRRAVRRGDVQDARLRPSSGTSSPRERYGVTDPKMRRFRYGVQVNSLGLTEAQPENNVQRIVLEMLGRHPLQGRPRPRRPAARMERGARPAPALGPAVVAAAAAGAGLRVRPAGVRRPLRGLDVVEAKVAELVEGARAEIDRVQATGRRDRGRRVGLHEAGAGQRPRRPPRPDRVRRGEGRRRQRLRDHRALAADRRPRRRDPGGATPRPSGRRSPSVRGLEGAA